MENNNELFDKENVRFRAHERFFVNSECVFIEYADVINLPWFIVLHYLRQSEKLYETFNVSHLNGLDINELLVTYINRRYRNVYQNFFIGNANEIDLEQFDEILENQIQSNSIFYDIELALSIPRAISIMLATKIAKRICIYHPYYNEYIEKDIKDTYGEGKCEFVYGKLEDVLNDIPEDTTYIFSDIYKIQTLIDMDRIDFSTVLLAGEYKYNFDENGNEIINTEMLQEQHTLHFSYFSIFE